jgi:hypothetical protein
MLRLPRRRMLSRTRSQKKQSADVNTLFHVLAENKGTWWLRFVISRTGSRGRLRFRHQMRQALEAAGSVGWRGALPYYYRRSITAQRLPFISCHSRSKHFGGCPLEGMEISRNTVGKNLHGRRSVRISRRRCSQGSTTSGQADFKLLAPLLPFFVPHPLGSTADDSTLLLNNSKAEGELRCSHAEERSPPTSQISDFN